MQDQEIQWSADDNSVRKRGRRWYIIGVVIIVVLAVVAFLVNWFLHDWQIWSSVGLAIVIFIGLIISNRQTNKRVITYALSGSEITINGKTTPLSNFRAFSISNNQGTWLVSLIPIKRVAMAFDLVIPQELGEKIVDLLGSRLPMEKSSNSLTDKFSSVLKI